MTPIITAFAASPDRGRGLARDMRVRWALEEVGQGYEVRLLSFAEMKEPAHLARQPFGQIPTYEDGEVTLFETGAIVLHIAERFGGLLPAGACAGAGDFVDVRGGLVGGAGLSGVGNGAVFRCRQALGDRAVPMVQGRVRRRLGQLSSHLGAASGWTEGSARAI